MKRIRLLLIMGFVFVLAVPGMAAPKEDTGAKAISSMKGFGPVAPLTAINVQKDVNHKYNMLSQRIDDNKDFMNKTMLYHQIILIIIAVFVAIITAAFIIHVWFSLSGAKKAMEKIKDDAIKKINTETIELDKKIADAKKEFGNNMNIMSNNMYMNQSMNSRMNANFLNSEGRYVAALDHIEGAFESLKGTKLEKGNLTKVEQIHRILGISHLILSNVVKHNVPISLEDKNRLLKYIKEIDTTTLHPSKKKRIEDVKTLLEKVPLKEKKEPK